MVKAGNADEFLSDHWVEMLNGSWLSKESPARTEIHQGLLHLIVNRTAFPHAFALYKKTQGLQIFLV